MHDLTQTLNTIPADELVKPRCFVGMTMEEAAEAMGMAKRTAEGLWTYVRAWLRREIRRVAWAGPAPSRGDWKLAAGRTQPRDFLRTL